jgi:hypothetical protein
LGLLLPGETSNFLHWFFRAVFCVLFIVEMRVFSFVLCLVVLVAGSWAQTSASKVGLLVELRSETPATQLAALACAGLLNRDENPDSVAGPAYVVMGSGFIQPGVTNVTYDLLWLSQLNITQPAYSSVAQLKQRCLCNASVAKGYIRYNWTAQMSLVPLIITLAGVLDAVPLEDSSPFRLGAALVLDATSAFASLTTLAAATEWVFDTCCR